MVGVINPNASTSLEHQRQLAENSTFMLQPGENWPGEGSATAATSSTTGSATPTATNAASSTTAAAASSKHSGLGPGAIAGIAIGGAAVLLAAAVAVYFCGRYSRKQNQQPVPLAPAQQVMPFSPQSMSFAKHASMVSGYSVPPGYPMPTSPQFPQHSPNPMDPTVSGLEISSMQGGSPSPNSQHAQMGPAPAYGQSGQAANV